MTGNTEHHVPSLNRDMVLASYVAMRAGGAAILPTSVGMIVGSASPRGLSTMFEVKERPRSKAGVVLTTMDEIAALADIPDGWQSYLQHMHDEGILVGSKLPRHNEHRLFANQPEWSANNSQQSDGTSMFVFLPSPGPYSDAAARILANEGLLLTASSANKSGEDNTRDVALSHKDIKRGTEFVAWDSDAVNAYPLDEANESQGVMVDFMPSENGEGGFRVIRLGFMNGPFITESAAWLRANYDTVGVHQGSVDFFNVASESNER